MKIKIAENFRAIFYAPFYAMRALDLPAREGVEVEWLAPGSPGGAIDDVKRGIIDATYAAILPIHVGMAQARDLLLSARKIDAAEALRIGLISRVVKHEDLRAEALKAASEILQTAPDCRAHVKRMLNQQYARIDYETMFVSLMSETSEAREGMTAFMEKRQPNWIPEGLPV